MTFEIHDPPFSREKKFDSYFFVNEERNVPILNIFGRLFLFISKTIKSMKKSVFSIHLSRFSKIFLCHLMINLCFCNYLKLESSKFPITLCTARTPDKPCREVNLE